MAAAGPSVRGNGDSFLPTFTVVTRTARASFLVTFFFKEKNCHFLVRWEKNVTIFSLKKKFEKNL